MSNSHKIISILDFEHNAEEADEIFVKKKYVRHDKELTCDICQYKVKSKLRILQHLLRHVKYTCQICSQKYDFKF